MLHGVWLNECMMGPGVRYHEIWLEKLRNLGEGANRTCGQDLEMGL